MGLKIENRAEILHQLKSFKIKGLLLNYVKFYFYKAWKWYYV